MNLLHLTELLRKSVKPGRATSPDGYVLLARRLYQGGGKVNCSPAVSMAGFNAVFVECTVFVFDGFVDPQLSIYVDVGNDRENWTPLPIGSTPVRLEAQAAGYYKLDTNTIGQQIAARWVRLRYQTEVDTEVIFSVGLDRKRLGA